MDRGYISPAMEVLEYLVLKKMAGRAEVLKALLEYLGGSLPPSLANDRYGISKHQLRGFVQRINEKAGDRKLAEFLIIIATPIILSTVQSRIDRDKRPEQCLICGRRLISMFPEDHLKKHHYSELDAEVKRVASEVKKILSRKKDHNYVEARTLSFNST
ncbi:MAG: hypothetical protein RQ885_07585 [Desulfurococcales archaeon]|jgi:hypothetical protein|nr:hypothetical protein [Desulfurococcales archaeon]